MCSEILHLESSDIVITITTIANWICAGFVTAYALSFMQNHENASIFFVFACVCFLAIVFIKFFAPETKGITLEQ